MYIMKKMDTKQFFDNPYNITSLQYIQNERWTFCKYFKVNFKNLIYISIQSSFLLQLAGNPCYLPSFTFHIDVLLFFYVHGM